VALCAPLIFWPADDPQIRATGVSGVTVTVPATVVVSTTVPPSETTTTTTEPSPEPTTTTTTTTEPITITVAAAGDVLTDQAVMESVFNERTGAYDFKPIFTPIEPYLAGADYSIACLEPRLAGPEYGYSDSPLFNAPRELAFTLRALGVDLVATANRHSLDFGMDGVVGTLDRLDAAGLAHVGTYRSPGERATPRLVDIRGVTVAFLDYTDQVNRGLPAEEQAGFAVGRVDVDTIRQEAMTARSWGADAVIVVLNYGEQSADGPTEEQTLLTRQILAGGADVIIGSRPAPQTIGHFVTYASWRVTDKFVAYSLGNLISSEREQNADTGLVVYVHFEKDGLRTRVTGVSYLPVYIQADSGEEPVRYRVLPVLPGLEPETDVPLTEEDRQRMAQIWEETRELLYRPDEGIVPLDPRSLGP
jgi:poly-gamma-glutamate synthesis protein (capsule biosynthesis protein)